MENINSLNTAMVCAHGAPDQSRYTKMDEICQSSQMSQICSTYTAYSYWLGFVTKHHGMMSCISLHSVVLHRIRFIIQLVFCFGVVRISPAFSMDQMEEQHELNKQRLSFNINTSYCGRVFLTMLPLLAGHLGKHFLEDSNILLVH